MQCPICKKSFWYVNYRAKLLPERSGSLYKDGTWEDEESVFEPTYIYECPQCGEDLLEGAWEPDWETLTEQIQEAHEE